MTDTDRKLAEDYIRENYGENWLDESFTWSSGDVIDALEEYFTERIKDLAPTDEEMLRDAKEYAEDHSEAPDKDCPEWIIQDYMAGAGQMRQKLTGIIIKKDGAEEKQKEFRTQNHFADQEQKGAPIDEEIK